MAKTGWWKGATLYQIYPRSFQDSNDDGVGDLPGITRRLDYIADLGVDGIWISPFFPSPMKDFGYDVSDYCGVDPLFGTLDDFDTLITRAHELGLKIVIDMVLSHTADQHPWFVESARSRDNKKSDWYVWADPRPDGTPPNNWLSIFGGSAWQWHAGRCQYYLHNFLVSQPDLNIHHPAVQDALLAACQFWLARGVDGFRLDAINFIAHDPLLRPNPARDPALLDSGSVKNSNPYAYQSHLYDKSRPEALTFLRRLRDVADQFGDILLLGEVGDDDEIARLAEYAGAQGPLDTGYCFRFLQGFINRDLVAATLGAMFDRPEKPWPSWAFSNHDFKRVASRWSAQGDNTDQAAIAFFALLIALPGTIFVYQGEELGLPQADLDFHELQDPYDITFYPDHVGRDGCRTPFPWQAEVNYGGFSTHKPWLPIKRQHLDRALDQQLQDPQSVYRQMQKMLKYRRDRAVLRQGDVVVKNDTGRDLVVIRRDMPNQTPLTIALNLSASRQRLMVESGQIVDDMSHGVRRTDDNFVEFDSWGVAFING